MTVFKCKICGGALEVTEGAGIVTCEYCGTKQTLPKLDDERRANLYDRAGHFRRNSDFDRAAGIYNQILNEDPSDAEAYWSLVLCRYGVEYVKDPTTGKHVPTVNRAQYTSIFDDEDYKAAIANADGYQREIYEAEASTINDIQKGILEISQKEEPFDVFVCYKESDKNGRRTEDSVLAAELYRELTREGFRVFYARVTLEDKLGAAYEPYIFAALHSAKVMVVLGTDPANFNAVWVKNEWSRYLALIKNGARKLLIPAYRDMDPYYLPEEFSHLQAQDMSRLGFMQDLVHAIEKTVKTERTKEKPAAPAPTKTSEAPIRVSTDLIFKRIHLLLDDGDFGAANDYCERLLDNDPENAEIYLAKLMIDLGVKQKEDIVHCDTDLEINSNYQKALRFASPEIAKTLRSYAPLTKYNAAYNRMRIAKSEGDFIHAAKLFAELGGYKDAETMREACFEKAEEAKKIAIYNQAISLAASNSIHAQRQAIKLFSSIKGFCDANERSNAVEVKIAAIKKRHKITLLIALPCAALLLASLIIFPLRYPFEVITQNDIKYQLIDNAYHVIGYNEIDEHETLQIPKEIRGRPVTAIHKNAFQSCEALTGITLPNGVITIDDGAFSGCTKLSQINIPASVTFIGEGAFINCNTLTAVYITDLTAWCNIKFDDFFANPLYYAPSLYLNQDLITTLEIPNDVTSIKDFAFYHYAALTAIKIPSSVTSIGNDAFFECANLTSVEIASSVTSIGHRAFYECVLLESITFGENSKLTAIRELAFKACRALGEIKIPASVTFIAQGAFSGCEKLSSATFENTIGWQYASTSTDENGTNISSGNLANTSTAASYLKSTYRNYYWIRGK